MGEHLEQRTEVIRHLLLEVGQNLEVLRSYTMESITHRNVEKFNEVLGSGREMKLGFTPDLGQ